MANFIEAYKITMKHEGGYVNDKTDAGGETYKGISRVYNKTWSGWDLIDSYKGWGNFPDCLDDNDELQQSVYSFYKKLYWDVNKLDSFPQRIALEMFDTGVNMGVGRAGKFLQKSLNYMNRNGALFGELIVDGKIGPASLNALNSVERDGDVLLALLNTLQGMHYLNYIDKNPSQKKYTRGWFRRVKF